ncbi:DUF5641 domain-containing protein [Trichonephila clavata]|uniref:DUF5641 domain-containing protein n=1 Tax=Trichonephila clavata TaxID=2740835 RepID=A0A8X6M5Y3_TRICU|nr:DUF5641 domain-containing protein [Trichonephila clavata]
MFLMGNSSIEVIDLDLCDFAKFQRRVKFRAKLLKDLRGRFRKEYLGLLVQKAHKTSRAFKVGEIFLIENPNKRLYWPLGKVVELIPGRDGKVRTLKLRCSNSEIIRPIQRVFPLEIQSAETAESDDVPLDADAPKVPSATLDVSERCCSLPGPFEYIRLYRELWSRFPDKPSLSEGEVQEIPRIFLMVELPKIEGSATLVQHFKKLYPKRLT